MFFTRWCSVGLKSYHRMASCRGVWTVASGALEGSAEPEFGCHRSIWWRNFLGVPGSNMHWGLCKECLWLQNKVGIAFFLRPLIRNPFVLASIHQIRQGSVICWAIHIELVHGGFFRMDSVHLQQNMRKQCPPGTHISSPKQLLKIIFLLLVPWRVLGEKSMCCRYISQLSAIHHSNPFSLLFVLVSIVNPSLPQLRLYWHHHCSFVWHTSLKTKGSKANISWYCWWTKSCTTKDDDYPYPIIYRVLTCFNHPRWCRISSINSTSQKLTCAGDHPLSRPIG